MVNWERVFGGFMVGGGIVALLNGLLRHIDVAIISGSIMLAAAYIGTAINAAHEKR